MKFKDLLESIKLAFKFLLCIPIILFILFLMVAFGDPEEEEYDL